MHPNNIHNEAYNFEELVKVHPELGDHIIDNVNSEETIDFGNNQSVLHLNKALLKRHYKVTDWNIPPQYLIPPIPGRADYIHHLADLLAEEKLTPEVKGLDIGVGANCIYPILGHSIYHWKMVGADIDENAVVAAQNNINTTKKLSQNIEIRYQDDHSNMFKGIIKEGEYFNFSMCNPPFHSSKEEAAKTSRRKTKNLGREIGSPLNFGGESNELWCNGGEALFLKRMIKESVNFKSQVGWFTSLISKNESLSKIYKQLDKLKATYKVIPMSQGNKKSRFIAWKF
ncbi:23S rRNA (adenine(1618)-N(6))-methyltransferase RlmF [Gillisia marina]|uniref:23S rRNA (adenine(1618)-N(6))-methyltransferase RlmF n=1 Tax=Gillisia marina TaxID=1167637 RepID=UPI000299F410|nr:23S rRNA (adenine(1618)-N(6))-methyltransferase RlmF [Gillisia marina]